MVTYHYTSKNAYFLNASWQQYSDKDGEYALKIIFLQVFVHAKQGNAVITPTKAARKA